MLDLNRTRFPEAEKTSSGHPEENTHPHIPSTPRTVSEKLMTIAP